MTDLWIASAYLIQRFGRLCWDDILILKRSASTLNLSGFREVLRLHPPFSQLSALSNEFWLKSVSDVRRWRDKQIQFIDFEDKRYPAPFRLQTSPPWMFSYLGQPSWVSKSTLSIVGSREPSRESADWLREEIPQFLLHCPVPIASGGARGVDRIVHEICLMQERPTIVFLPSGLLELYPKDLSKMSDLLMQTGGAFVSEFVPDARIQKFHFERRNRLIAALSPLTLVVDAKRKSGSLLTARLTAECGRALAVLPGHPRDPGALGSLDLLYEGATFVRDFQDLLSIYRSELNTTYLPQALSEPLAIGEGPKFSTGYPNSEKN